MNYCPMELALTIIAGLGALLFIIGYLGFVVAGFKHHFVTGIISVLPVLNIVTIPALWYTASKKIIISTLGIIIIAGSWFMGADKGINKTLALLKGESSQNTVISSNPAQSTTTNSSGLRITSPSTSPSPQQINQSTASKAFASKQRYIANEGGLQGLPSKALYRMAFESIPVDKISALSGRIIKITTNGNELYEGRVTKVSNSSVFLKSGNTTVNELPVGSIKSLQLMVKKAK